MKYSKCKFKYLVEEDFYIQTPIKQNKMIDTWYCTLWPDGILLIKKGFASDGASGPTIDTDSSRQPSIEHDVFYKLLRKKLIGISWRPIIDEFLYKRLIEEGMWKWRASVWLKSLQRGGKKAASKLPKIYITKHHNIQRIKNGFFKK